MLCDTETFRKSFPLIIYIKHLIRGLSVTLLKIKLLVSNKIQNPSLPNQRLNFYYTHTFFS